jgi:hypothetical protein
VLVLERASAYPPRTIAQDCILDRHYGDGAEVGIVGFGAVNAQGWDYVNELQEGYTIIIDDDCSTNNEGCNPGVRPDGELIAGEVGIDSCYGDSGGPLYLMTDEGEFLIGVTSRGTYSAWNCAEASGGIYVRADAVIPWIEQETGRTLPVPNCNGEEVEPNEPPVPTIEPAELQVGPNEWTTALVSPNDPNANDTHTYAIGTQPEHGVAEVDGEGNVSFGGNNRYKGWDSFTVVVTDNRGMSGEVFVVADIHKRYREGGGGCGCSAGMGAGAAGFWLFGSVLVAFRRRH